MTTSKTPAPLLLVFILLNLMLITATLTISPWRWIPDAAVASGSTVNQATGTVLAPDQALQRLLTPLLQSASAVVYGEMIDRQVAWNWNHTQIDSYFTVAVAHTLVGRVTDQIQVHVSGGYLPSEGIGMWSSHEADFAKGEAVLLFLGQQDHNYQIVQGEKGKFTLDERYLVNPALALTVTPAMVERAINLQATRLGRKLGLSIPTTTLQALAARGAEAAPFPIDGQQQFLADPTWPDATISIKVNINSDSAGDQIPAFRGAILRAMRTWSVVADADFTLLDEGETAAISTGYNGTNEILFMHRGANSQLGQAQIWFTESGTILEADIWINDDYQLSASQDPAFNESDLESIVLHELGHWIPLGHSTDPQAVMYAVLNEGTKRVLQSDDVNRLITLYPCPASPCINDIYLTPMPTETPTPIVSATPTLIPTAEATPTLIATVPSPTGDESIIYLPFITR